jgi:hypothetical protein
MLVVGAILRAYLTWFVISTLAGCASQDGGPGAALNVASEDTRNAKSSASAAPANYRQLIIRYLQATHYAPYIRRALISRPYEEWMGLINGGHRPAVCVEVYRETPLFAEGRDIWIFSFQDGQIASAGVAYPGPGCKDLSPLNEVAKRK